MKVKITFFFFIFIYKQWFSEAESNIKSSKCISNSDFDGFKILEKHIDSFQSFSLIRCSSLCTETDACLSFAYNDKALTCVMYDTDFTDISSTQKVIESGWQYSYLIKSE